MKNNSIEPDVTSSEFQSDVYSTGLYKETKVLCKRFVCTAKVEITQKDLLILKMVSDQFC